MGFRSRRRRARRSRSIRAGRERRPAPIADTRSGSRHARAARCQPKGRIVRRAPCGRPRPEGPARRADRCRIRAGDMFVGRPAMPDCISPTLSLARHARRSFRSFGRSKSPEGQVGTCTRPERIRRGAPQRRRDDKAGTGIHSRHTPRTTRATVVARWTRIHTIPARRRFRPVLPEPCGARSENLRTSRSIFADGSIDSRRHEVPIPAFRVGTRAQCCDCSRVFNAVAHPARRSAEAARPTAKNGARVPRGSGRPGFGGRRIRARRPTREQPIIESGAFAKPPNRPGFPAFRSSS